MSAHASEEEVYLSQVPLQFPTARVFLVGPSGSGKSAVARSLSNLTGVRLIDTDADILRSTGYDTISKIWEEQGETFFRRQEMLCLDRIQESNDPCIVATGGGLPAAPGGMTRIMELGVSVYLHATLVELWARLAGDLADRPLLKSGGPKALQRLIDDREETYRLATLSFDTSRLAVEQVAAMLATHLHGIDLTD